MIFLLLLLILFEFCMDSVFFFPTLYLLILETFTLKQAQKKK